MTPSKRDKLRELAIRGTTEGERRAALARLETALVAPDQPLQLAKPAAEAGRLKSQRNALALYALGLTAYVWGATGWAWLFAVMLGWAIWSDHK